jgi:hypothetical protein
MAGARVRVARSGADLFKRATRVPSTLKPKKNARKRGLGNSSRQSGRCYIK